MVLISVIPPPLEKLVTMAMRMPSTFKTVKEMASIKYIPVPGEGTVPIPGVIYMAALAGAAVGYQKLEKKLIDVSDELNTKVQEKIAAERDKLCDPTDGSVECEQQRELVADLENLLREVQNGDWLRNQMAGIDVNAIILAQIEKVKPPINSALAPFTAIIGIPIFLIAMIDGIQNGVAWMEDMEEQGKATLDVGGRIAATAKAALETTSESIREDLTEDPFPDPTPEDGITLQPSEFTLMEDEEIYISATVRDGGKILSGPNLEWSTDNDHVTVVPSRESFAEQSYASVTGVSVGTTQIEVVQILEGEMMGGMGALAVVTVIPRPAGI